MKIIVDANVWISLLLARGKDNTIHRAIQRVLKWPVELILPMETSQEVANSIAKSSYLASRIPETDIDALFNNLSQSATMPSSLNQRHERIVRDPGDDYLIAYGLIYHCDYLLTGDADLLTLGQIRGLQIITPLQFTELP